ncbi:MAG: 5-methylcytosine-specific restriction enzyme subunit McrC [Candidatus Azotimanducaceae bacterium]|jgi:5-methylcytosine-specific restriction enzyme subunit McrC
MSLWVSEYGTIIRGNSNLVLAHGNLQLCSADFDSLVALTELNLENDESFDQLLTFHRRKGLDQLKVKNHVGIIRAPSGAQIEILPKLTKRQEIGQGRQQLIKMLMCLRESPFKEGTVANLDVHRMPLFELFLRQFLEHVVNIVKRGIARTYVAEQDNLRYLRGKLILNEQIKHNSVNRAAFYCEYDEYEVNRPINRLLRGALDIVARCSRESNNVRLCNELRYVFDRVPPTKNSKLDFSRIQRDRSVQHYEAALPLCELILNGLNPLTSMGGNKVFSLLFPMERVFESYVVAKLRQQLPQLELRAQVQSRYLVDAITLVHPMTGNATTKQLFQLRPDIELKNEHLDLHFIADTKWKLLDEQRVAENYEIKQSDMYQLFAYGEKYLGESENSALILIYPKSDQFTEPLPVFWFDKNQTKGLHVLPFDLESDKLILDEPLEEKMKTKRSSVPSNQTSFVAHYTTKSQ